MKLHGKRIDLPLLKMEADAASVVVGDLGTIGLDEHGLPDELITWDDMGSTIDVPPEMQAVVDNHVAPPSVIEHVETRLVSAVTRTTDGVFHEIWRLETRPQHIYRAALEMEATDASSGTTKAQEARLVFKGLSGSVVQVGTTTVLWSAPDVGTTNWAIQAQVQGTYLVFGVRGAAGVTIDWTLAGDLKIFAPEGLEA